ncbi:MAG TPA: phosphotransferase family protein [Thermoleophilaceae bacterium]
MSSELQTVTVGLSGLHEAIVGDWILGLGFESPLRFERIGNGQSNLTYRVADSAGNAAVLRRPPFGPLLPSAHDVAREYRILRALEQTPVPAPAVQGFTDDPAVSDVPLLLTEFVEGPIVADLGEAERARVVPSLAHALASVHEVDLRATGLDDLASHAPYAPRQVKRWRRQWAMSRTRDLPALTALSERLAAAAPTQHDVALVHGDYHPHNVIVATHGGDVRAILDWELCTLGDPVADVGTLLAYWGEDDGAAGIAEAYAAVSGRDLAALPFWHALALWKIAIICEGVRRRVMEHDQNSAPGGAPPALMVEQLVERAWLVVEETGL